LESPMIHLARY